MTAATLREAHRLVETGSTIGKIVLSDRSWDGERDEIGCVTP
jgi:hypothetical protein